MIALDDLPAVNAALNGTAAALLIAGYLLIRRRRVKTHAACMIAALAVSTLFLASYLYYHYQHGTTRFAGTGWVRPLYFALLGSHTVLAAAVPALAVITLYRAARSRFEKHVKIARWTLPIWLYVSVTGVTIYFMLYQLYPPKA